MNLSLKLSMLDTQAAVLGKQTGNTSVMSGFSLLREHQSRLFVIDRLAAHWTNWQFCWVSSQRWPPDCKHFLSFIYCRFYSQRSGFSCHVLSPPSKNHQSTKNHQSSKFHETMSYPYNQDHQLAPAPASEFCLLLSMECSPWRNHELWTLG